MPVTGSERTVNTASKESNPIVAGGCGAGRWSMYMGKSCPVALTNHPDIPSGILPAVRFLIAGRVKKHQVSGVRSSRTRSNLKCAGIVRVTNKLFQSYKLWKSSLQKDIPFFLLKTHQHSIAIQ